MSRSKPLAVDLFCGVGGMALGFEEAGFRVVASVDVSEINVDSHKVNFPRGKAICADVAMLTGAKIRRTARIGKAPIAVVFGGPPCQGFSIGGQRKATDHRNALILEFARLVTELRPRYFVMENVGGLLQPRYAPLRARFLRLLRQGGYEVVHPIATLNAADFGVPQRRKRAFVLGYRSGNAPPAYPKPQPRLRAVTVNAAIGDLLLVEKRPLVEGDCYDGPLGRPSAYARRLRARSPHATRRANLEGGLSGFARTAHSRETVQRFRNVEVGAAEAVSRFIRLDPDGLAPTLRAGTGFENGRFMAPRPIHHKYHRVICTREAARLHSYPDWFAFHETKWHSFMQIGNSVPPTLARVVAAEILRAIRSD